MTSGRLLLAVVGLMVPVLMLSACKEQGRALHLKKGEYVGRPHTPLSDEARRALSDRISHQGGGGRISSTAGGR